MAAGVWMAGFCETTSEAAGAAAVATATSNSDGEGEAATAAKVEGADTFSGAKC